MLPAEPGIQQLLSPSADNGVDAGGDGGGLGAAPAAAGRPPQQLVRSHAAMKRSFVCHDFLLTGISTHRSLQRCSALQNGAT